MAEENIKINKGDQLIGWQVHEFEKHERSRVWYLVAGAVGLLFLIYAFFTSNFLFFGIIIIGALVIILLDGQEPDLVNFSIADEGIVVGRKFYDYDLLKDFSLVYKPNLQVKKLYFEFKNSLRPRISVPLEKQDPLKVRKILLKYLPEDLERTDQPTSESLSKLFKL